MLYADEFRPCDLDPARRRLLKDFEKVRDAGCSKWLAKRKFAAEKHLMRVDERLKVRR